LIRAFRIRRLIVAPEERAEEAIRIGAVLVRLIVPQRPERLVEEGGEEEGGGAFGVESQEVV